MTNPAPPDEGAPEPEKPSLLAQAAKALSQIALTFYGLLLLTALFATSGSHPIFAIMMAVLAGVPVICGPGAYRLVGVLALVVAGGFYASSKPPPKRPGAQAPQPAIMAAALPASGRLPTSALRLTPYLLGYAGAAAPLSFPRAASIDRGVDQVRHQVEPPAMPGIGNLAIGDVGERNPGFGIGPAIG